MSNIRYHLLSHLNNLGWMPEEYSSEEDVDTVTAVGDLVSPETPSNVIATNGTERIKIEWDKVTTNVDGSDCNDLSHYNVYYSSSSGIDIDDSGTYDGVETRDTLTWSQEVSVGNTKYYVVTAEDETGNESPASSEVSAISQAISVTADVSDYSDNFSDIQVGDGIIGLIFRQPNSSWDGYSHYKLYRDELGGSSWTSIFEGPNPAYVDKGVSAGTDYKYKLTFVDVDGNETNGTVRDNSSSGYNPNNADNSNITAQTFLAPNIVAQNEVRGNSVYAESQIVLGGVDNSGYIKSSNYSAGTDGFIINADGNAEFNDVTVRGEVDIDGNLSGSDISNTLSISGTIEGNYSASSTGWQITGGGSAEFNNVTVRGQVEISSGSGISNLTDSGDLATKDAALVSNGDVGIDGDLTVTGNLQMANNDVQLGASVPNGSGGSQEGLYIKNGGAYIEDAYNRVIFDSNGNFRALPTASDLNTKTDSGQMTGNAWTTMLTISNSDVILGGLVMKAGGDPVERKGFQVRISDNSGSETITHPVSWNDNNVTGYGTAFQTGEWAAPGVFLPLPTLQVQGSATLEVYNDAPEDKNWQITIWYS